MDTTRLPFRAHAQPARSTATKTRSAPRRRPPHEGDRLTLRANATDMANLMTLYEHLRVTKPFIDRSGCLRHALQVAADEARKASGSR
jgi:hypothetical protein